MQGKIERNKNGIQAMNKEGNTGEKSGGRMQGKIERNKNGVQGENKEGIQGEEGENESGNVGKGR
jgi:hypothetical protein